MNNKTSKAISKSVLGGRKLMNMSFWESIWWRTKLKSYIESVHEGKKPYECDICNKVLDEEQNFKRHIESGHKEKKP